MRRDRFPRLPKLSSLCPLTPLTHGPSPPALPPTHHGTRAAVAQVWLRAQEPEPDFGTGPGTLVGEEEDAKEKKDEATKRAGASR